MTRMLVEQQEARIWEHAQRLGTFTCHALSADTHIYMEGVRAMLRRWEREGRVVSRGLGKRRRKVYQVCARRRDPRRAVGSPAENMWRTARKLGRFVPADIEMHASTPDAPVTAEMAHQFCQLLMRGGYVRCLRRGVPGQNPALYHLVRDTGPRPPAERRVRAIWDANEGRYVHVPEPQR